jgi:hypothetical protein
VAEVPVQVETTEAVVETPAVENTEEVVAEVAPATDAAETPAE